MLWNLFARVAKQSIDHRIFGRITFSPKQGWENDRFSLWGFDHVLLMVDAPATGPTQLQEESFRRMLNGGDSMLARFVAAISEVRMNLIDHHPGAFLPRAVSVPSLGSEGPGRTGNLWTIWFDCEGDDHWSYGVQSEDDWATLHAFVED
jgi:hypothetical protein